MCYTSQSHRSVRMAFKRASRLGHETSSSVSDTSARSLNMRIMVSGFGESTPYIVSERKVSSLRSMFEEMKRKYIVLLQECTPSSHSSAGIFVCPSTARLSAIVARRSLTNPLTEVQPPASSTSHSILPSINSINID
jgi:hypothetical protein